MNLPLRTTCMARPRLAGPRGVRASADGLQPWQASRLQQAAGLGRRQVKVEKLCKELQLPRAVVLDYLKKATPAERDRSVRQEPEPAVFAVEEEGGEGEPDGWQQRGGGSAATLQPDRGQGSGRQQGGGSGPAWKRFTREKTLGRQAEATLEMVYSRTQWPSDEVVESMWDLHRIRRDKVIEWFQSKRREDRQGGGGQQRRRGGGDSGQRETGLEWFDEAE